MTCLKLPACKAAEVHFAVILFPQNFTAQGPLKKIGGGKIFPRKAKFPS